MSSTYLYFLDYYNDKKKHMVESNKSMAQNEESVLGIINISVSTVSYQKGACWILDQSSQKRGRES